MDSGAVSVEASVASEEVHSEAEVPVEAGRLSEVSHHPFRRDLSRREC